jgi:quinol-cytochrome oxidoreductase complex cytochrome b subunit
MIIEALGYYNLKEPFGHSSNENELTEQQVNFIVFGIFCYIVITLTVAIRFPIGGNVVLSLILAMFFSTIFWIIKITELIFGGFQYQEIKRKNKKRGRKRNKATKDSYYDPIY